MSASTNAIASLNFLVRNMAYAGERVIDLPTRSPETKGGQRQTAKYSHRKICEPELSRDFESSLVLNLEDITRREFGLRNLAEGPRFKSLRIHHFDDAVMMLHAAGTACAPCAASATGFLRRWLMIGFNTKKPSSAATTFMPQPNA